MPWDNWRVHKSIGHFYFLSQLSSFSGNKFDFDKHEILPLLELNYDTIQHKFPFKWSPSRLKHLGILVDKDLKDLI